MNKCIGCGATLQDNDETKQGYIIPEKKDKAKYCQRCFKITNYNEKIIMPLEHINEHIIEQINKNKKYVYFLIDILNINNETINTFKSIKNNKTLVISKLDIIPKSIKEIKIVEWLREEYQIDEDIIFLSSKKNINISSIEKTLLQNHQKDCYILGYTNAGKSTLINKLNNHSSVITTSLIPNTTLDFIKIKINENMTIIDSPGFTLNKTLYKEDEFDLIKRINPKDFIKPRTYQVKDITSLIIENKIKIKSNKQNSLTFYMSNDIIIDKLFNTDKLNNFNKVEYNLKDNSDIVIKGIGFINVKKACKIIINIEDKSLIEIRKSMFNGVQND
ncbi:MAG: GTPase [Candidatus Coprovivens sp.]